MTPVKTPDFSIFPASEHLPPQARAGVTGCAERPTKEEMTHGI
jgi:hypothetical protein